MFELIYGEAMNTTKINAFIFIYKTENLNILVKLAERSKKGKKRYISGFRAHSGLEPLDFSAHFVI